MNLKIEVENQSSNFVKSLSLEDTSLSDTSFNKENDFHPERPHKEAKHYIVLEQGLGEKLQPKLGIQLEIELGFGLEHSIAQKKLRWFIVLLI